jgi:pimeloyl-ACP methyl ester carboxylesterase
MQTVTSADGTSIAFERHGAGPPLILLHGGSSPQYWKPVVPRFGQEYTVVVPHRRGVGESGDAEEYSLDRGVEDVRAVINAIDGTPVLFGHSFGGLLAIETARTTPVEKLIVYEPAVLVGEYRRQADLASQMQTRIDDGDRRQAMKFYIREVMHGSEIDDLEGWLAEWPPWPDIVALTENIARINRAIEQYRLPDALDVDAPTLLLTGTEGPPHLRDGIRAVDDALSDNRFVEFEGVGHGGPTEAPGRVTSAVRAFIDGKKTLTPEGSGTIGSVDSV